MKQLYITTGGLARSLSEIADEQLKPYGITTRYALILIDLADKPGLGQSDLCNDHHLAASSMTRFIDKLEKRGWVERLREGRTVSVQLTEEGEKVTEPIQRIVQKIGDEIESLAGDKFAATLNRMNHFLLERLADQESSEE
ncbi:MAG: MarR family transcriptional regulator [Balneolaceae bacterium]